MMAKKSFRLEQVLTLRKEVEKTRILDFAEARQEFEGAEEKLKQEETTADSVASELQSRQEIGISSDELRMYADFLTRKTGEIKEQRTVVQGLEKQMVEKREDLLVASQEKKVLEKLKSKKLQALQKELDVREQAFLDEIALRKREKP